MAKKKPASYFGQGTSEPKKKFGRAPHNLQCEGLNTVDMLVLYTYEASTMPNFLCPEFLDIGVDKV
jgi:hypothetical protein